jgi:hypothetical protein
MTIGSDEAPAFRWRRFGIVAVIVSVAAVTAWTTWLPPFYLENDDVSIRMALEGHTAPGQPPTGFVLGISVLMGWAVVAVERLLPSISWWDVALAGTLVWAFSVLIALVWDALGSDWLARATAVGALLIAMAPILAGLQFTISSTLAGGAALLLALSELGPGRRRVPVLLMALLLFAAGLLVRPMGAPAGAVTAAVLIVPIFHARRWPLALVLGSIGLAGVSYLGAQQLDRALFAASREWDEYYRYNQVMQQVESGLALWQAHRGDIQAAVGWSANDWSMLLASLGVDPMVHGFDRVNRARETLNEVSGGVGVQWVAARALNAPLDMLRNVVNESALLMMVGGVLAAALGSRRAVVHTLALLLLFAGVCVGVDLVFDRLPFRLLAPLQVIFTAMMVVTIGASRGPVSPWRGVVALGAILAIVVPEIATTVRQAGDRRTRSQEVRQVEVAALQRLSPSLVIHSGRFPREFWWRPFHRQDADIPAVGLGWNNQNPQVQRFLSDTGRQPLLRALCHSPSMFLVIEEPSLDLVRQYVQEHFDTTVDWTQVYAGTFPAWRCSAANPTS